MPTEETQAASSPAEAVDVFQGQQPTMSEYSQYRETGEVPERFKPAEQVGAATTDSQEKTESEANAESADEAEASKGKTQEPLKKPRNAAQRIAQIEAAIEEEWDKDSPDVVRIGQLNATIDKISGKPKRKSEVAPPQAQTAETSTQTPQQQPQNYQDYRRAFKPSQFIEEYAKANPEASYEDANAAMADHLYDVRKHFDKIEERVRTESAALNAKVEEAKERYENFDEVKDTFLGKVLDKGKPLIPVNVLEVINGSDVLADLIYTLGSDEKATTEFVKMAQTNPIQAIRHIARLEVGIQEELSKAGNAEETQGTKAPVVKKTQAPKPPEPVTGASSRAFDVNDDSLSADDWMKKRNAQVAKRS